MNKPAAEINLTKESPGLKKLLIGAGWDFNPYDGDPLDIDLSCFALGRDGKTRADDDFVFYNQPNGAQLAIKHLGDNRTGAGDGDDEAIMVDIDNLNFDVWRIVFVVSIYQGNDNDRSFGDLKEATLRVENADSGAELFRMFFGTGGKKDVTAIRVAEIERNGTEWSLKPLNEPVFGGLAEIAKSYGILVSSTT
ncbi:MAG TPA: TerD family protein [Alphaproteobacteria bacterium]